MEPNAVRLCYLPLRENFSEEVCERLLARLPKDRREKALALRCDGDRKCSLFSETLLRALISAELVERELRFTADALGKPRLEGGEIAFNISHTRRAVAIALARNEVGVDIERIRPVDLKVASRFSADETEYVMRSENREERFFEIWTKKEAHLKRLGVGLRVPLSSFSVLSRPIAETLYTFRLGDHVLSVCHEAGARVSLIELTEEDVLSF